MKVLLIHGLARTSLSLVSLEQRLRQAQMQPEHFGYAAFVEPFDRIVERLCLRLQAIATQGRYSVVAHSLGGLLTRAALQHVPQPPVHIVMLGTPNQRPRLAVHAWKAPPFRWFTGQCGLNLTCLEFFAQLPAPQSPYTIIAGTAGPQGAWSPFGQEPNDGIVALSETRIPAARVDHRQSVSQLQAKSVLQSRFEIAETLITLPVWHTFMMNDAAVQGAVVKTLGNC